MYLTKSKSMAYYGLRFTVHSIYGRLSFLIILQPPLREQPCSFFSFFSYCSFQNVFSGRMPVVLGVHTRLITLIPVVLGIHTWFIILIHPFWLLGSYLSKQKHL